MFWFGCLCKCHSRELDGNNLHNRLKNSRTLIGSYIIRVVRLRRERRNPKAAGADGRPSCRRLSHCSLSMAHPGVDPLGPY